MADLGVPQVLVDLESGFMNWASPTVSVTGWLDGRWEPLLEVSPDIGPLYGLAVHDRDADGDQEIALWGFRLGTTALESSRSVLQLYEWRPDLKRFSLTLTQPSPANFRFQVLEDAQLALDSGDVLSAIALYLAAVHGFYKDIPSFYESGQAPSGSPEEFAGIAEIAGDYQTAFARFRLAYLFEAIGQPKDADDALAQLRIHYPAGSAGNEFAQLTAFFIESTRAGTSLPEACRQAVEVIVAKYPHLAGFDGHIGDWGFTNIHYDEETLCPED